MWKGNLWVLMLVWRDFGEEGAEGDYSGGGVRNEIFTSNKGDAKRDAADCG